MPARTSVKARPIPREQIVAQGDEFGRMGTDGTDLPELYMEFRRSLDPVDPIVYLYGLD